MFLDIRKCKKKSYTFFGKLCVLKWVCNNFNNIISYSEIYQKYTIVITFEVFKICCVFHVTGLLLICYCFINSKWKVKVMCGVNQIG